VYQIIVASVVGLVFILLAGPVWISFIKKRGIGQPVREDGPQSHLQKSGTPTMGGVLIVAGLTLAFFAATLFQEGASKATYVVLATTLLCGAVGFMDDYLKISHTRSLGLRARWKLLLLFFISLFLTWGAVRYAQGPLLLADGSINYVQGQAASIGVPQLGIFFNLGLVYFAFIFLVLTATTTAVNFTDGLDGLATGTVALIVATYAAISFLQFRHLGFVYGLDMAVLASAIVGACGGFLWFNSYPADIFMGDTGALALGGALAALAVFTKTEFLLILIGGLLVVETLSVIIQVVSFRWFGRRVFKMAPLHHHFELKGWSEFKIVVRFWVIASILAASGFTIFFMDILRKG
jgi:phospho-N-acetylmuramoyl-pentapeptide-transferase